MCPCCNLTAAPHTVQRSLRVSRKGWTAQTGHRTPWDVLGAAPDFSGDVWELSDTTADWTQSNNLAKADPAKLAELQRLFLIEAARYNVLPLDDQAAQRMNPEFAGRPTPVSGNTLRLYPGMVRLNETTIDWAQIDLGLDDHSHLLDPEEWLASAMRHQ